jgi:hypothetical protein
VNDTRYGDVEIRLALPDRWGVVAHRRVVVVDGFTRPTPTARVLPFILRHLADAGIAPERVATLITSGAHGPPHEPAALTARRGARGRAVAGRSPVVWFSPMPTAPAVCAPLQALDPGPAGAALESSWVLRPA